MKKLMLGILVGAAGLYAFNHVGRKAPAPEAVEMDEPTEQVEAAEVPDRPRFHCDGRVYCSQMTSCNEATFFLENCPGAKMDGDRDGIPCERQWCENDR
jgi:hypothetical protein